MFTSFVEILTTLPFLDHYGDGDNATSATAAATTTKRDFTPNVNWESGNDLANFQRALVVVCFFIFSPIVALLFRDLFLKLARLLGFQRWITITEILRRYENFNKVVLNTKLILNKQSPTSPSDNVCGMRDIHFFSESDKELLKNKKTVDKNYFARNEDTYMVCPHNIEIHNGDTILEEHSIKTILFKQRRCSNNRNVESDGRYGVVRSRKRSLEKPIFEGGGSVREDDTEDVYFDFGEEQEEKEEKKGWQKGLRGSEGQQRTGKEGLTEEKETKEAIEDGIYERMRIEKRFEQEVRPLTSFLRGNFVTFLASIISLVIFLVGWIIGLALLGISFTTTINGSTFLLGVTLFKIADGLKSVLCYFSLLVNDTFERGDIIEVYGPYGFTGGSVVGCVYDITLSSVKLITFKPYQLLPISSTRLDMAIREVAALQRKETAAAAATTTDVSLKEKKTESTPEFKTMDFTMRTPTVVKNSVEQQQQQQQHYENIQYIEKPQRAIAYLVNIPTSLFYDAVTNRHMFWEKKLVCYPTPQKKKQ